MKATGLSVVAAALASCALAGGMARAEGLEPLSYEFENGGTVSLFGQINRGVLAYDDGRNTRTYAPIDNNNANSRLGVKYQQDFDGWSFENVYEIQYTPYSTMSANILNRSTSWDDFQIHKSNIRRIEGVFSGDSFGKIWVGQGPMATNGITQIDNSGTTMIAYAHVSDTAGAQYFRYADPNLSFDNSISPVTVNSAFNDYNGNRRVRLRYDTPVYEGFTASVAAGRDLLATTSTQRNQNLFDAALRYGADTETFKINGGIGFYYIEDVGNSYTGSVSALHKPTGLNATLSTGASTSTDGRFIYGKLGLLRDMLPVGKTAFVADFYAGRDIYINEAIGITGSDSNSYGIAAVQNVDAINSSFYLTYRLYDYSDNSRKYDQGHAVLGGVFFKF